MSKIDQEVRTTAGDLKNIIHLPNQNVDSTGIDIDLTGVYWEKEDDSRDCYHFAIVNKGTVNVYIAFDGEASSIDTTDDDNVNKTYQLVLDGKGGADFPDRISIDGYAEKISLKCKATESSDLWILIK